MNKEEKIKKVKSMYITARQFKNVIESSEIISTQRNNFRNKVFPFIVNKSLACEIYLKLILFINQEKECKIHNIKELSQKTKMDSNFREYLSKKVPEITEKEFEECLKNISEAFEEWRYIYEKKDITIRYGYLNTYCDYLDTYCKSIMKELLQIDVEKELRYI